MAGDDEFCSLWVGNLSNKVDKDLLYELFLQAGPVGDIMLPKDSHGRSSSYGFVTFKHQCSVPYAIDLFHRTALFGRELKIRPKQRLMPVQTNEMHSLNSLRGYSGSVHVKSRDDFVEPNIHKSSDSMMPRGNFHNAGNNMEPPELNVPDFNMLLQMGQLLQNPYGSMMGGSFEPLSSPGYPSQMMNPAMSKHEEDWNRHNRNDHHSRDRYDHDKMHPYRDSRRDDRRYDDRRHGHHNNSRHRQSSNSHRRERK